MNKQITMSPLSDELSQAKTKKKEFLAQIDRIIPWDEWLSMIQPCYYKGWLDKARRLWKNCERKIHTSAQMTVLAFIAVLIRRF